MSEIERLVSETDRLVEEALALGATRAAVTSTDGIRLHPEVRRLCAQNSCGKHGANWMCPPAVGSLDELAASLSDYGRALVVQSVSDLDGPFDVDGMDSSAGEHQKLVRELAKLMREEYGVANVMPLGAGPCMSCKRCTIADEEPCPYPDRAISSMEAYGMNVKEVVEKCGLKYSAGPNTVSYVAAFLYRSDDASPASESA
jgi:predicted metal-binding protein